MTEYYYNISSKYIRKLEENRVYFYSKRNKKWNHSVHDSYILISCVKIPEHLALLWITYD